jgi:formate dehydrogenase maturation protein FdhE
MSEARTFFRHCPFCKRRFEIRLVGKRLVGTEEVESETEKYAPVSASFPLVLESDVPIVVRVEDFRYTYRCKHCGHQWSEERFKDHNERLDREHAD